MKILSNKAQCKLCGDIVESTLNNQEYIYCKCRTIAVAGGNQAILRLGNHINIIELSEKEYSSNVTKVLHFNNSLK